MPILKRSCCGCDLQTGSIVCGCLTLLGTLVFFIGLVLILVFYDTVEDYLEAYREQGNYVSFDLTGFMDPFTMLILSAILAFVYMVFTCVMMYGAREERRVFLMPWMLMTTLEAFAVLVGIIMTLYIYMLLIVVSYYQYLKDTQDGYYPPAEMSKN